MADMSSSRHPMPQQAPEVRRCNFSEVALGYTEEDAVAEANRCLNCKNKPCISKCPVAIDIPAFIEQIRLRNFEAAYGIISRSSSLPAVCGRVCPQETQCESKCVRGLKGEPVAIGRLERFVADWHMKNGGTVTKPQSNGLRVAVVGGGPAGLTCAGDLARRGYSVTVFEALHVAGGVLVYGIPEFRLPKAIVQKEIDTLKELGVEICTNSVIGRSATVDELLADGFKAVFLGTGAGLPRFMGIPGENLCGVYSANEFLTRINLMKAYKEGSDTPVMRPKKVAVVGGGNVAMDSARCARRLGADVTVVYRRSEAEMPARREEVEHAKEEGITFLTLNNPLEITGNDQYAVTGMKCQKMQLGEPDASGRRSPVPVEGSEFALELDCVIMAIGTSPNPLIRMTTQGLDCDRRGCIVTVDESGKTSKDKVYAGGDTVTGAATVILAMGAGKAAAAAIDESLQSL